jgi:hypothetical protein
MTDHPTDPSFEAVDGGRVAVTFEGERWRLPRRLLLKLRHDQPARERARRACREARKTDPSELDPPFLPEDQQ